MRLLRHGERGAERPGLIGPDGVMRDLSGVSEDLAGDALGPEALAGLSRLDPAGLPPLPAGVRLGPCVGRVGNFIAVGLNFADHAAESGQPVPKEPVLFNKAPSCIVGPNDDVLIPPGSTRTDWEVELAIVIGRGVYHANRGDAVASIAGYCVCHDVSERDFQMDRGGQWMKGKGCPTFGPLGPWLVTPDEIADVQALGMWLDVNGERMQTGHTSQMVFGVHDLVHYACQFMALEPGDVITTGTPPGVGMGRRPPRYLQAGDVVELGVDGLGAQRQRVLAAPP